MYSQGKDLYKIKMFLFSKAGGCFRNYLARKKNKTCCS